MLIIYWPFPVTLLRVWLWVQADMLHQSTVPPSPQNIKQKNVTYMLQLSWHVSYLLWQVTMRARELFSSIAKDLRVLAMG